MAKPLKVYSLDFVVHATIYVKAQSKKEALTLAQTAAQDAYLELDDRVLSSYLPVAKDKFDSPKLPTVSVSPWCTGGRTSRPVLVYDPENQ